MRALLVGNRNPVTPSTEKYSIFKEDEGAALKCRDYVFLIVSWEHRFKKINKSIPTYVCVHTPRFWICSFVQCETHLTRNLKICSEDDKVFGMQLYQVRLW
jgi:hypothetical protein